jgi:hypothetical protein
MGYPMFIVITILNPSSCPSSSGVRELISVAIPYDLLGKKRSIDGNVRHGKTKDGQDGERERVLP